MSITFTSIIILYTLPDGLMLSSVYSSDIPLVNGHKLQLKVTTVTIPF